MKKILILLLGFSMVILSTGCADDPQQENRSVARASAGESRKEDLPNISPIEGKKTFSEKCDNPIRISSRASEKEIDDFVDVKNSKLKLESVTVFTETTYKTTGENAYILSKWENGKASVLCHNSFDRKSTEGTSTRRLDSFFSIPMEIDSTTKKIVSTARLEVQARAGRVAANLSVQDRNAQLPAAAYNAKSKGSVKAVLVRNNDGKIVLRLSFPKKGTNGNADSTFYTESVYSVKTETQTVAKPQPVTTTPAKPAPAKVVETKKDPVSTKKVQAPTAKTKVKAEAKAKPAPTKKSVPKKI